MDIVFKHWLEDYLFYKHLIELEEEVVNISMKEDKIVVEVA